MKDPNHVFSKWLNDGFELGAEDGNIRQELEIYSKRLKVKELQFVIPIIYRCSGYLPMNSKKDEKYVSMILGREPVTSRKSSITTVFLR